MMFTDNRNTMDDWSKKLLEQHGAMAFALKEIEQRNRYAQTVADSVLNAPLAAEYQRTTLLRSAQDQSARLHAEPNTGNCASWSRGFLNARKRLPGNGRCR